VVSALQTIAGTFSQAVSIALLALWDALVGFLNTVFTTAGWPNGFSELLNLVSQFLGWTVSGITQLPTVLTQVFIFITATFGTMVSWMTDTITYMGTFYTNLTWMWNYMYQYVGWIPDVLTAIFPLIILLFGIWVVSPLIEHRSLQRGFEGMQGRISLTFGTVFRIAGFLWKIIDFTVQLVTRLIGSVPMAE